MWYNYGIGTDAVIHWQKIYDQKPIETVAHTFRVGNFEFSIPIESYLTFEYFNGSRLIPNTTASYFFVLVLSLASVLLLTVITTFKKFWYFVGMGLFILFIVSLRLDVLRIFGFFNQWTTVCVLIVYGLTSFWFNAFSSANFTTRILSFSSITAIFALLIYFFAKVPSPFLHLSVTGYIPGLILTIIFTIMVAHEILASFVYLTSQGSTSSKSLNHFLIISVVYLTNIILAYMHEAGVIQWNFLYINLYLLFSVSAVLGVWGYRQRENLYEEITFFNPFGAYFIIGLGSIAFATIGMLLGTANDPALKVIRDFIIFSHLGFGLIFMIYIFSNFIVMMAENLNVYKVLYQPNRMPYFTYRFAGFIAMLAFVFYSNWHEYVFHASAGFYNNLGDLYTVLEDDAFAEAHYEQGRSLAFQNHRSNYVIGYQEAQKGNFEKAHYYYELANSKRPSEYSMVNEGNLFITEEKFFKGLFSFKNALHTFPSSGVIKNNLGYTYAKIHMVDSALLMFDQARQQNQSKEAAELNFAALVAQEYLPVKGDSLTRLFKTQSNGVISNALVIAITQNQRFVSDINPFKEKELNLFSATMLNNYIVNKIKEADTTFTNQAYQIATDSVNADFSEALKASLAYAFYHQNNVSQGLEILGELAYVTQSRQGKYNYIMGLWALEQGNPDLAVQSFEYAVEYSYKEAKAYKAIALAESHQLQQAIIATDTLIQSKNQDEQEIGKKLKKVLTITASEIIEQTDVEKYQFCRYRLGLKDSTQFYRLANTIQDVNLKAQAILDWSQRQFDNGNTISAIGTFNKLDGLKLTDKNLFDRMQHFELELLASRGQLRLLAEKINEGITFSKAQELEKLLYTAMLSEASGDTVLASKNYSVLATYNPFYEEGIIAAARYFKGHSKDTFKAYNILTNAMHVNRKSVRLLTAYMAEAARMGFDNYVADAEAELQAISR
jgi:hypothetical protein